MSQHIAVFALGLALLAVGGMYFAFGSARVARRCGASPFAVGLIAAGLGTASAALAFDLWAVAERPRLAFGNIVGVQIANIGLVLGLAALVRPLAGKSRVVSAGIPLLIGATLLFCFVCREEKLATPGAAVLVIAFILSIIYLSKVAKQEPAEVRKQFMEGNRGPMPPAILLAVLGLAALIAGGAFATVAAGEITLWNRLPSRTLGITIAALATSLPGLMVAVVAAFRGRSDLALGAVVGGCLFNLLLGTGITGLVTPIISAQPAFVIEQHAVMNELPALAILTMLLLTVQFNALEVPRWQGVILLLAYAGFIAWEVMSAR